jgi:uncharacterized protein YjbI with pentapeptide repeats
MADWDQVERLRAVMLTAIAKAGTWNHWRRNHPDVQMDLSEAHLVGDQLVAADLHSANLRKVDFRQVNLNHANLKNADLTDAALIWTTLVGADLQGANLCNAQLTATQFYGCNLHRADLSGAILHSTVFANVDLRDVIGLETCHHAGPSVLDHRTLSRSGRLPLAFLRGCGLPDNLIDYLASLMGAAAFEYYSCFISYSTEDEDCAERLYADLQNKGVRCWFAPHNIQAGKKIHEQIDEAIRIYDCLLLILSEHSMNSEWVKTEIAHARQKELNEQRRVLFPISVVPFESIKTWKNFDDDTGKDSAREIREYLIPDFSDWKNHDSYRKAFELLLRDLKAEKPSGAGA